MDRYNIVKAFLSGVDPEIVQKWVAAAPNRFIPAPFILRPGRPDPEMLRKAFAAGRFAGPGEIATQLTVCRRTTRRSNRILRVSGPFTVEAVQPAETSLGLIEETAQEPEFGGAPTDLGDKFTLAQVDFAVQNVQAYLAQMIQLLRTDGVRFPKNRQMQFTRLEPLGDASGLHAEGRWVDKGGTDPDPEGRATVVVSFGPQYGPVKAPQVAEVVRAANRRGYDNLVIAGFSFDGAAQTDIEESQHPKLHIDMAHIRPDVNPGMKGLLKEQPNSQLFSVFGQPRCHVTPLKCW